MRQVLKSVDEVCHYWANAVQERGRSASAASTHLNVGNYRLDKIRKDGSVVVGCHDIPYTATQHIAQLLSLVDEVPQ